VISTTRSQTCTTSQNRPGAPLPSTRPGRRSVAPGGGPADATPAVNPGSLTWIVTSLTAKWLIVYIGQRWIEQERRYLSMAEVVKFLLQETGDEVAVRVFSGPDYDSMHYSGTLVVTNTLMSKIIDCLIYGAGDLSFATGFQVYYGPEEDDRGVA
jgi:hypothetical protein